MSQTDVPKWVSRADAEAIHKTMIDIGGGSHGLRDEGLLESALARPQNLHAYGENDIHQVAASYAEGIARNHPFIDGNKRTAFATADLFLSENGHNLEKAQGLEHVEMMEKLGQGQIDRDAAAAHLRDHSRSIHQQQAQGQSLAERVQLARERQAQQHGQNREQDRDQEIER